MARLARHESRTKHTNKKRITLNHINTLLIVGLYILYFWR